MLAAFVTGFAQEASSMIDERNKDIADRALTEMETLLKKKMKADEAAIERRDELRKQAAELRARSGNRLTESQIVGILENGYGSIAIERLKEAGTISDDAKMKKLFTPADPNDQRLIEDYIKEATTLTGKAPAQIEETTAFGLKTRAGEAIRQRASAKAGMPLEEIYKTELPGISTKPSGTLDLSVLSTAKDTMDVRIDQAARNVADAETDEDKNAAQNELDRLVAIQARTKPKDKDGKISQSDIRSTIKRRLEAIARAHISGDYTTTNDGSINIHSTKGREIFLGKLTSGLEPLLKSYIDAYKDDQGRVPNEVRFAWEAEGARFNDKGQFIGFDPSLFQVTKQPDAGESLKNVPASPPVGGARPSPGDRSGISAPKQYTQEQLRAATIRAINANPQEKDKFIKEYEAATGLKFNG